MLIESRPRLHGATVSISDRTLDVLLDHLRYFGLADDSREIGRSIGALNMDSSFHYESITVCSNM